VRARTVVAVVSAALLGTSVLGLGGLAIAAGLGYNPRDDSGPGADGVEPPPVVTAAPSPTATTGRPLDDVLRPDDVLPDHADLLAFFTDINPTDDPDWARQQADVHALVVDCMADAGFWYDPRVVRSLDPPRIWYVLDSPYGRAFEGSPGAGDAYRWQDAGCFGAAVEQAGTGH
jgi:hypothetical protein